MNLYDIVAEYDKLGYHRTGVYTESKTLQFLCDQIEHAGGKIEFNEFTYLHFAAESSVRLNGREIPSIPLYYESTNSVHDCSNVEIASVDVTEDEARSYSRIVKITERAKRNFRDAVVVATCCESASLQALNVTPLLKNNLPVVLVPGRDAELISNNKVILESEVSVSERTGRNIIAYYGDHRLENSLVITTPISGWFRCAGERGAGIAMAINLASHLGLSRPVTLVLTTGHELGYLGGFEFTDLLKRGPPGVIHIGSCVGASNADLSVYSNLAVEQNVEIEKIVAGINTGVASVSMPLETTNWVGESECWARFGCPMLSIAGYNPLFHTPEDRLPDATTPGLLDGTFETLLALGKKMSAITMR